MKRPSLIKVRRRDLSVILLVARSERAQSDAGEFAGSRSP